MTNEIILEGTPDSLKTGGEKINSFMSMTSEENLSLKNNLFQGKLNLLEKGMFEPGFLDDQGTKNDNKDWLITNIMPIKEGTHIYYEGHTIAGFSPRSVFYDSNMQVILSFRASTNGQYKLDIPENSAFFRMSVAKKDISTVGVYAMSFLKQSQKTVTPADIVNTRKTTLGSYTNTLIYNTYYNENSIVESTSWARTEKIPVKESDLIEIQIADNPSDVTMAYLTLVTFDSEKNYVESYVINTGKNTLEYTVEEGVAYIGCNILLARKDQFKLSINGYDGSKYALDWLDLGDVGVHSYWRGKTGVMFGDSIVAGQQDDSVQGGAYARRVKDNLQMVSMLNKGVSGRPMANGTANGVGTNTTIKETTDFSPFDLVIIAAGTNDFKLNVPLGSLGTIADSTFDTNTFYGAYRDSIEHILKSNLTIRLCLWTPLYRDNGGYTANTTNTAGHKLIDYVNAIKNIGELYAIPVIDMFRNSGLNKVNLTTYTVDGLHLNGLGYDIVSLYASKQIDTI